MKGATQAASLPYERIAEVALFVLPTEQDQLAVGRVVGHGLAEARRGLVLTRLFRRSLDRLFHERCSLGDCIFLCSSRRRKEQAGTSSIMTWI
jgi:hypothetical protein